MSPADSLTWVIGGGGLLGGAIVRRTEFAGGRAFRHRTPWHERAAAEDTLLDHARALLGETDRLRVVWCAGAGVVSTGQAALDTELDVLRAFFDGFADLCADHAGTRVSVFLASSAGGVYAGSTGGPATESTTPVPLAAYGAAKLAAERVVSEFARRSGAPVLVGRIANLYGPGQDLGKRQGLISQLCRSQLERQPLVMYVPLETARDYIYVDDAADMIMAALDTVERNAADGPVVKIVSSGQATTLAAIIGEISRITRRRPPVILGESPAGARVQAPRLDFRSIVMPELSSTVRTPLPAGILATYDSVAAQLRSAR